MKFIVSRNELYKNLSAISGVLSTNNTMPILDNFLFTIVGNTLTVTASDLDCTMSAEIMLSTVEGEGSIAVPAKNLLETLKLMSETPINFVTEDDGEKVNLKFSVQGGEYNGHCFLGNEYPQAPMLGDCKGFEIDAPILHKAISKTLFATGNDDLRPTMMGVLCELNEDNITFVATDAHKLVKYRNSAVQTVDPTSFILPKKPLQQLKSVIAGSTDSIRVDYSSENNHIRFSFGNIVLYSSLLEGSYPKYRSVIPTNNDKTFVVSRDAFLQCIRRVGLYANQSTYQIRVSLTDEVTNINSEDIDYSKKAHESLSGTYTGEPMDIGFNAKFLREILENVDAPEVQLDMSQPNRAAIIYPVDQKEDAEEHILMLIMPVMLNNN
ncbi:MAG: DNA polymerase III subunit beta [Bacteroidales bacterium]|nr:DNA polymerase III subunit beta [Bacteroidales bacterium]